MRFCNYYVTLRSNDTCEFGHVWQNTEHQNIGETDCQEVLLNLKKLGGTELKITGGEPLLREDLPELLRRAKELGFKTTLSTNGILYAEKAKSLAGLADRLCFSLDYPLAEDHDRSRGTECFHQALRGIHLAQEMGDRPAIKFTVHRDNVRFLPEMVDLAERLKVLLYVIPVYDFHGTQGFEPATLAHIRYYFKRRSVLINLAALEFVKASGNRTMFPRCRAKSTTITIMPDGKRVSPCFFNPNGREGREDVCSSCMRWPYMLPSFAKGIDKYFWLNLYSNFINQRKGGKT